MTAPDCCAHLTRIELLDHVNCLLQFDQDGSQTDTAMGLMRWNNVTADELNARRADPQRGQAYRPITR